MATKVLTRYNLRRRATTTKASDRPRKRQKIEKDPVPLPQDPSPQDEMSELAKQARINHASQSGVEPRTPRRNQVPPPATQNTPSSNKLSAQEQHSSSAREKADSPRVRNAINKEFISNYKTCATLDEFFQKYMPSQDVEIPSHVGITGAFNGVVNGEKEVDMYGTFLKGLRRVSRDFPNAKKMACYNTSSMPFPPLHPEHHDIKPDISSTFPGVRAVSKKKDWTWQEAALVWELKLSEGQDSIDEDGLCKHPDSDVPTRVQLYKGARNLMMAHLSCFVFIVGVYGTNMRFFRFDHSGIIGSPSFNYVASPELVQRFLWRLAHPLPYNGHAPQLHAIVGADPTITKPSSAEFNRYFTRLLSRRPEFAGQRDRLQRMARIVDACVDVVHQSRQDDASRTMNSSAGWNVNGKSEALAVAKANSGGDVEISDEEPGLQENVKCFAFDILHLSTGVVGRATHVFKVLILGNRSEDDQIYTLKDSWQQQTRWDEGYFYRRIKRLSHEPIIREELKKSILNLDLSEPGAFDKTGLANNIGTWNMKSCEDAEVFGFVTLAARLMKRETAAEPVSFDRSRVRSLMKNIGRPLSTFRRTQELIMALYNAVRVIKFLRICGVLHRDISSGNILLDEFDDTSGFLHDLDYSSPILSKADMEIPAFKLQIKKDLKDMTGTRPFMAISILADDDDRESHAVHHDLESVYWVAIWCILRHTEHTHKDGMYACLNLFDEKVTDSDLEARKEKWLRMKIHPAVKGNQPLTLLIEDLRKLFRAHHPMQREAGAEPVTVKDFLEVLERALKRKDWPSDDKSLDYVPPPTVEELMRMSLKKVRESGRPVAAVLANQDRDAVVQSRGSKRRMEDGDGVGASRSSKRSRNAKHGDT